MAPKRPNTANHYPNDHMYIPKQFTNINSADNTNIISVNRDIIDVMTPSKILTILDDQFKASQTDRYTHFDDLNVSLFVKSANAGLGTTATRELHKYVGKSFSALHYQSCISNGNPLSQSTEMCKRNQDVIKEQHMIEICARLSNQNKGDTRECLTQPWLNKFQRLLVEVMKSDVMMLSDSPYVNFIPNILQLKPDIIIFHTQRDPYHWAQRRIQDHFLSAGICSIERIRHVSSLFNIEECVNGSTYLGDHWKLAVHELERDAEITNFDVAYMNYAAKFVAHNRYIRRLIPSSQYFPLCMDDNNFVHKMEEFFKLSLTVLNSTN